MLERVRIATGGRFDLLQFFLELQISAAFADGDVHPSERNVLHKIARGLGFSSEQLERRLHMQEAAFRFQRQGGFGQQQGARSALRPTVVGSKPHKLINWLTRIKFWVWMPRPMVKR